MWALHHHRPDVVVVADPRSGYSERAGRGGSRRREAFVGCRKEVGTTEPEPRNERGSRGIQRLSRLLLQSVVAKVLNETLRIPGGDRIEPLTHGLHERLSRSAPATRRPTAAWGGGLSLSPLPAGAPRTVSSDRWATKHRTPCTQGLHSASVSYRRPLADSKVAVISHSTKCHEQGAYHGTRDYTKICKGTT